MAFQRATRKKAKLRLALFGPSGSGKTYSALLIAQGLGGKVALIDTEQGSGELYANLCEYDVAPISAPFGPQKYIDLIHEAERSGYNVIIIDSISHAWAGDGGLLDIHDKATKSSNSKNSYNAWREVTPLHNKLVDAMLQSKAHIIVTARSKVAYEQQENDRGKKVPVKIGLAPIFREGLDYEMTVCFELAIDGHIATTTKDRTSIFDGKYFTPSLATGQELVGWLEGGFIEIPELKIACAQCATRAELAAYFSTRKDEIEAAPNKIEVYQAFNYRKVELPEDKPATATPPQADAPPADEPIDPATADFIAQDAARGEQSHV